MNERVPVIWIIATGSEILQGHYADRNGPWLSEQLKRAGLRTARHMALPDRFEPLCRGLAEARDAADVVIVTGGLGPTEDDLNRQAIAQVWEAPLEESADAIRDIEQRLSHLGRTLLPANRVQASIPRGSTLVHNANGTAPGFFLPPAEGRAAVLALPGPPWELQPMFEAAGLSLILEALNWRHAELRTLTFRTTGLAEAAINERLRPHFASDNRVELSLLFTIGIVDIRVTLLESDREAQERTAAEWRARMHELLGPENIFGENTQDPAEIVAQLLRERGERVTTAESCSGGLVAAAITSIAGASEIFSEGFVTYANEAKIERLGVDPQLIERHGAVSPHVAEAMADGARNVSGADWAISVTGIAGPTGGTPEKPVGLVWFGLARPDGRVSLVQHRFAGGRDEVRRRTVITALDLLRRGIQGVRLVPRLPEPE